jgi:hypothetical protein
MSPGGHLVTTAAACAAAYAGTGSAPLVAGMFAGGFLIDVDHIFDYLVFEGRRDLRPSAFLAYYLEGRVRRVVLLLHSYELLALLAALAWLHGGPLLWGYVLGMALHLPLDILYNGRLVPGGLVHFYSFAVRWRAGFLAARFADPARLAPVGDGFWSAFFVGARLKARQVAEPNGRGPDASLARAPAGWAADRPAGEILGTPKG